MVPEIRYGSGIATLFVEGKPFLCLAGEIHNSSASHSGFMEENVWENIKNLNMNSIIVPLYWELIEAEEGCFDYTTVDSLIAQARRHSKKLILLWFGLWKNAESMYVPGWMKRDSATYFRAQKVTGEKLNTISPLCEAAVEKDRNAFRHVMKHICEIDEKESTVIVMQVENEIGLLGTARDYSPAANDAFEAVVPVSLANALGVECGKSWKDTFGKDAEESFMAYCFGTAVEKIASAGRKEYPLPCYANAWLKQYPWYPGSYPSGGPVVQMQKIWRAVTPSLFTFGPDIYVPYVPQIMDEYAAAGNALFIPEVRKDAVTASYCLYAFGQHNAICYSPFGIEELGMDPSMVDVPPMEVMIALNIDPSAFDIKGSAGILARTYELVEELKPLYFKHRGTRHLRAFVKKGETDYGTFLSFDSYDLQIAYGPKISGKPIAGGQIYELAPNRFLVIGLASSLTFMPKVGENKKVDILRLEEGTVVGGVWHRTRILNGDEKMSLRLGDFPTCMMIELFKY